MTAEPDLIASSWTLAGNYPFPPPPGSCSPTDFRDRIAAAAKAGYKGIGLGFWDLSTPRSHYGYPAMRRMLEDHGLIVELEAFIGWFGPSDPATETITDDLLRAAEILRPRHLKAVGNLDGAFWPIDDMAARFETLARRVGDLGAKLGIEILPQSNISTLETALAVIGDSANRNAGLTLDIWHVNRGGISYEDIAALDARQIVSVELDDADAVVVGSLLEDMTLRRRLCGEGCFDIPGFIEAVRKAGYRGPFGVEIVSDEQRARPLQEAAERSFATAMAQFGLPATRRRKDI
jgi:sugar phosphate isomerase/epimerase